MEASVKIRQRELNAQVAGQVLGDLREMVKAGLSNPAFSLVGAVALSELLRRQRLITDLESALLIGVITSAAAIGAFKPIFIGLGDK